jgi:hypothetical protein
MAFDILILLLRYHFFIHPVKQKVLTDFVKMFVYIYMSHVVVIRFPNRASRDNITKEEYKAMLTAGLLVLAQSPDIKTSIMKFIPLGTVGIKTNCLTRKFNSTPAIFWSPLDSTKMT